VKWCRGICEARPWSKASFTSTGGEYSYSRWPQNLSPSSGEAGRVLKTQGVGFQRKQKADVFKVKGFWGF